LPDQNAQSPSLVIPSLTPYCTLYHRTQQVRSRATVAALAVSPDSGAIEPGSNVGVLLKRDMRCAPMEAGMAYRTITGTFLEEITHDIASQNWGEKEWTLEFDTMVEAGIDTVVLIRSGYRERLAYPSVTIPEHVRTLPVNEDLIDLFLRLCGPRDIAFFLGTYDSGRFWHNYAWREEVEIHRAFLREAWARYGGYPAFGGWYLSHETPDTSKRILDIHASLAEEMREISDLPILISPFFSGRLDPSQVSMHLDPAGGRRSAEEHVEQWEEYFSRLGGLIDFCAFQDGTAEMLDLEEYVSASAGLARRYGVEPWSNLESFDRDVPMKFPPLDSRKLIYKLETVQPYVNKVITFEFSHFMSPNSMWPSARMLYQRYREFLASERTQGQAEPKTGRIL
jgi:hypothetical protein